LSAIDTTYVLRRLSADLADKCQVEPREQERWVSLPGYPCQQEFVDRFHSPSQETAGAGVESIRTEQLAGQSQRCLQCTRWVMRRKNELRSVA